jgi:hypothetical protein
VKKRPFFLSPSVKVKNNQREEDGMELLMVLSLHFFALGTWVLIICGIISYIFPQLKWTLIVLVGMIFSYFYTLQLDSFGLNIFAVIFGSVISLLAASLVKLGFYAKQKAERLGEDDF